ncbi:hypothetical protein [Massilia cavernae]|uniref:Uncharacterized protein n=1 Tax=Massilia cavernae TaxID=2320864 RepID=A0A418XQ16_9BURK|nr:hypothetical protein [Massilia cavernae]RJG14525.1 hypothetical protein D3872_17215 [Massilia cavernae]
MNDHETKKVSTGHDVASPPISPPPVSAIPTRQYNHQKEQEKARRNVAYWLVWIVASIIFLAFAYLWTLPLTRGTREYVDNLVQVLQIVFAPIITLAGTAIGYYFGANASQR